MMYEVLFVEPSAATLTLNLVRVCLEFTFTTVKSMRGETVAL